MKIEIPSILEQQKILFEHSLNQAIKDLNANLNAPSFDSQQEIDELLYSRNHLLDKSRYEAPHCDLVGAYFRHFQSHFSDYDTDKKLAGLLFVRSDRRIREFKQGVRQVPYEIWDRFLVMTGRKNQEIIKIFGFMG